MAMTVDGDGHEGEILGNIHTQGLCDLLAVEQAHRAFDTDIEFGAGLVRHRKTTGEDGFRFVRGNKVERLGIDRCGCFPIGKIEFGSWLEEDAELPALRSEPETFFAAEDVDFGFERALGFLGRHHAFGDEFVIEPTVTVAAVTRGRAGHDAALISR